MNVLSLIATGAAIGATAPLATAQPASQESGAAAVTLQPGPAPFIAPDPIRHIVDQQLGTRYAASQRDAVARCATAALAEGAILYGVNGFAGTDGFAATDRQMASRGQTGFRFFFGKVENPVNDEGFRN
jgi:hypothetical protein